MALTDPTQMRTTAMDNVTVTAGLEPWNKNLNNYLIPGKDTEAIKYVTDWFKWHGLYREVAELRSTIDTECRWIISKEIKYKDAKTKAAAKRIKGNGKKTFRQIIFNHKRTSMIAGDAFAWIPRDKAGRLMNIKELDPGTIEIEADKFGVIKKYNQVTIKNGKVKILDSWKPKEIWHTMNDPIADEIHGIPEPEKLQKIIKMRQQAMSDSSLILHRYGKPTYFFEADTDDETELASITATLDKVFKNFENSVTPKGTFSKIDRVSQPHFGTIDAQPWHNFLRSYFTESSGVPDLVRGKSDEVSLAAGKLNLLSYKEKIIMKQMEYEEEMDDQLGLSLELERPIEIDIEISRTEEDQELKESAKRQQGGDLQTTTKKTNEKK